MRSLLLLCIWSISFSIFCSNIVSGSDLRFLFDHYNATIQENSRPRTYVGSRRLMGLSLESLPPSSHIRFYIKDGDDDGFFTTEMEKIGGVAVLKIRTRTGLSDVLNRERTPHYDLIIEGDIRNHLKSYSLSVSTSVRVQVLDINDNIPLFLEDSYDVTIDEDTSVYSSIIRVNADDADIGSNGKIYYLLDDPSNDLFSVHPTNGIVTLTRPIDYSQSRKHELVIVAEDRGVKPLSYRRSSSARTTVKIKVKKVNLHSPKLLVNHLPNVVEHSYTNIYAIITVKDSDSGKNGEIKSVDIIHGDSNKLFNIVKGANANEYNLVILKLLDRELAPSGYNLTVRAIDKGYPSRSGVTNVQVNIADINDQVPVFLKKQYEESVSEEAPPYTAVVRVAAEDHDLGNNGKVIFRILAGNEDNKFNINSLTGLISTNDWLDAEVTGYYSLAVAAIDQASNAQRKQSSAKVIIRVQDGNDNAPQFSTPNTEVSIDENEPMGSYVTRVLASDVDSGENGFVSYSIANLDQVPFTIDPFDGTIRTSSVLDFEAERRVYTIKVRASDWGQPLKRETETTVKVKIRDINDNRPVFVGKVCSGWLDLDANIGSTITKVRAIDLDDGDKVFYRLEESDLRDCWNLDSSSGDLSLSCKLRERFSQVKKRSLIINITATDSRHISDKAIITLAVIDKEREVVELNRNNARVACEETDILKKEMNNLALARENNEAEETFALFPPRYGYNTHAPEFPPKFPEKIDISEDAELGSLILSVGAKDHDRGHNGRIVYSIASGDVDSVFKIDTNTGIITLWAPLDRERTRLYLLNISAYDLGEPHKYSSKKVTINILDVNDNAPQFTQLSYSLHLPENMRNGTSVAQIIAEDLDLNLNGKITYELLTKQKEFYIDPSTGILYVTGSLNREDKDEYDLRIRASDNALDNRKSSMARVMVTILDINDCAPDFGAAKHIKISIPEDLPVGAVVTTLLAYDKDLGPGGLIHYSLLSGSENSFRIDAQTGIIRVAKKLNYRDRQIFDITIKAEDEGFPTLSSFSNILVQITNIDENSSPPRLPDRVIQASVLENQPPGTLVTTLKAYDPDGGTIQYDIVGGSGYGIFVISNKGELRTLRRLDRETSKGYWLAVTVSDGGTVPQTDTCHVYVDVDDINDHVPQSELPVYRPTVSEDAPIGSTVVVLRATDGDLAPSNITYFISRSRRRRNGWMLSHPEGEEDAMEVFQIDKLNGVVTTSAPLDRERQAEYDLWIGVTDGQLTSLTAVFVTIGDVNDNAPEFMDKIYRFNVPAVLQPEKKRHLFRIFAMDRDIGRNSDIRYSLKNRKNKYRLKIDENTGTIYSSKMLLPEHSYDLTVKATDNGNPQRSSTAHIIVRVVQTPRVSLNAPEVETPPRAHVMETDSIGHVVAFIMAFDKDNDTLWYYIEEGNDGDRFSIGLDSGVISLSKELDREMQNIYSLTIAVTDGVHVTKVKLPVQVLDFNDHRPIFSDVLYRTSVSENLKAGSTLLKLSCYDRDSLSPSVSSSSFTLPSSSLFFSLHHTESIGSTDLFTLDAISGKLSLAKPLNRELHTSHMLTVSCQDRGGIQREDMSRVIVTVDDFNDHVPSFLESMIQAQVSEGIALGSIITRVLAIDQDEGENGRLSYSIAEGNQGGVFSIDEELGTIYLSQSLSNRNSISEYLLLIRAMDHADNPKSASVPVRIGVKWSGDSVPTWATKDMPKVIELSEWAPVNQVVALATASSPFSLHYEITEGNSPEGAFVITPSSGVLSLQYPLDYETKAWYNLTIVASNSIGISRSTWIGVRVLDENDGSPEWEEIEYNGFVLDSAVPGSPVLLEPFRKAPKPLTVKATDKDTTKNGLITYSIIGTEASKLFSVDFFTGAVRVSGPLDQLASETVSVHVWARDSGDPQRECITAGTVNIKIQKTSVPSLSFSQDLYRKDLFLPLVPGVVVACIPASFQDKLVSSNKQKKKKKYSSKKQIYYNILSGNEHQHFKMDNSKACVYISDHIDLDDSYNLTIAASSKVSLLKSASLNVSLISSMESSSDFTTTSLLIKVKELPEGSLKFSKPKYWANVLENSTNAINLLVVDVKNVPLNHHVTYSLLNAKDFFEIRSSAGVLKTSGKPFDREKQDHYILIVEGRDVEDPDTFGLVTINVAVLDINDNKPVFVGQPYDVLVSTSAGRGHVVTKVRAIDGDNGSYGKVRYELVRGSGELFTVGKETGEIILKQPLIPPDKTFSLTVAAYDGGKQPLSSQAHVLIRVVSAKGPIFDETVFRVKVPENKGARSAVTRIEARSPSENALIYSIVAGDSDGHFDLDFATGINGAKSQSVVRIVSQLDFESKAWHNLTIRGRDPLTGLYADCQVLVEVMDVNDNPPKFQHLVFYGEVSEAASVGYSILKLSATDADRGLGGTVRFECQDGCSNFTVDADSGEVLLNGILDAENRNQFTMQVVARDLGLPSLHSTASIIIKVLDMNDNAPVWDQRTYNCRVSTEAKAGHVITSLIARDYDISNLDGIHLVYHIIGGDSQSLFNMDLNTGLLSVSAPQKLVGGSVETLNVSASDGVHASFTSLRVHILAANSHAPRFLKATYEGRVDENVPPGQYVLSVGAMDLDGEPFGVQRYHILNQEKHKIFSIDHQGKIFTEVSLDRELKALYEITVSAIDGGGKSDFTTVRVYVRDRNDNPPVFAIPQYQANIPVDTPPKTTTLQVTAEDRDEGLNSRIRYSLYEDNNNAEALRLFSVEKETGKVTLNEPIEGRENEVFQFFIRATDQGDVPLHSDVPVTIFLIHTHERAPFCSRKYAQFFLQENAPTGTVVTSLWNSGPMEVKYTLLLSSEEESSNPFDLSSVGELKVKNPLDHEKQRVHKVIIVNETLSTPPLVDYMTISVVVMDVNDCSPEFSSSTYSMGVPENCPQGAIIAKITATDKDEGSNGQIQYAIKNRTDNWVQSIVSIDPHTGAVSLRTSLDKETNSSFSFTVLATDSGAIRHTAEAQVYVDILDYNDNPPVFSKDTYVTNVLEDTVIGTVIVELSINDEDSQSTPLDYFVMSGDDGNSFLVDDSGQVYVARPLDRETRDHYTLIVTATDGKFTANASIFITVIDVNDNGPSCTDTSYYRSVAENIPVGNHIVSVSVYDPDEGFNAKSRFKLRGLGAKDFSVDQHSGKVFTAERLDRETMSSYLLTVVVEDWEHSSWKCESLLQISVSDVNDNAPSFAQEASDIFISEGAPINAVLTKVIATDPDLGINRKLKYSLTDSADGHFAIDPLEGILSLAKHLDRETTAVYEVIVTAQDSGSPSFSASTILTVTVTDINDNPPEFVRTLQQVTVAENEVVGTDVARVMATSKDIGINAEITYHLEHTTEIDYLTIHPKTGVISINSILDFEKVQLVVTTVIAEDGGTPPLSATALLNVTVTDINDNAPVFSQVAYQVSVSEDQMPGRSILQISANDADCGDNGEIWYSITGGAHGGNAFSIERDTGILFLINPIDREQHSSYKLEITGTDKGSPSNSATTVIKVKVLDVNDNAPKFQQRNYSVIVQENRGVGYPIIHFEVTDADTETNARPFTWEILGPMTRLFTLDQDGTLRLSSNELDHRIKNFYRLALRVWDSGSPPLSADTKIDITVVEESRYPPTLFPLRSKIVSYLKPFPGGEIGKVTAVDNDPYDILEYSLVPFIKGQNYFEIDKYSGKIQALTPLDSGGYRINISVTDGKFERSTESIVDVFVISDDMVEQSVIVHVGYINPNEFLSKYRKILITTVAHKLNLKKDEVKLIGVQPTLPYSSKLRKRDLKHSLDILLVAIEGRGRYMPRQKFKNLLEKKSAKIKSVLSLSLFSVMNSICDTQTNCSGNGKCEDYVNIHEDEFVPLETKYSSLVTPRFSQEPACLCYQGFDGPRCENLVNACGRRPCFDYEICTPSNTLARGYSCHCTKGMAGPKCNIDISKCQKPSCHYPLQPLSFKAKSYAQYNIKQPLESNSVMFTSYIRTRNPVGVIFFASGDVDYNILEVSDGYVQYRWDCGSGEGLVRVPHLSVDDNEWHFINLTRQGVSSTLSVDHQPSTGAAPGVHDILNVDSGNFYLGAKVETYMEPYRSVQSIVEFGFVGCIDLVTLNGIQLPVAVNTHSAGKISLKRLANVELECPKVLVPPGACGSHPCLNGGTCNEVGPNYSCHCPRRFTGKHCQIDTTPCASSPCLNGGQCTVVGHSYVCKCPLKLSGKRCEYGVYCNPNPCQNGGRCEEGSSGPICKCQQFTGSQCQLDIDECTHSPCQNGGTCMNLYGGFRCLCAGNATGEYCNETTYSSFRNMFTVKEFYYILVILLVVIFIIVFVICFWRRKKGRCKRRQQQNNRVKLMSHNVKNDLKSNDGHKRNSKICNVEADLHQQGPLLPRPSSYTPNGTADSVLLHTLKHLAEFSSGNDVHEGYELNTLSLRRSQEYLHNMTSSASGKVSSPSANGTRKKPWDHHNNLNESYFTPTKEVSFDLPPNLDDHPRPISPCLNTSFTDNSNATNHKNLRPGYQWDDYDIRGSTSMLTFSNPNSRKGPRSPTVSSPTRTSSSSNVHDKSNDADPLIDSSSDVSSSTNTVIQSSGSPSTPLLATKRSGCSNHVDMSDDERTYSFDEVLQKNNISVSESSSEDEDDTDERNNASTPLSVIEMSKPEDESPKYNIVPEEKISNIPPERPSPHLGRLGSPRSRRPYIRSDFGRVSDVSFISSLEGEEEYENLTKDNEAEHSYL